MLSIQNPDLRNMFFTQSKAEKLKSLSKTLHKTAMKLKSKSS